MIQKLMGGVLIFAACAGVGFMKAAQLRNEELLLSDTVRLLSRMENELSCRRTPLPKLCELAQDCRIELKKLYTLLLERISSQALPDVSNCMNQAMGQVILPKSVSNLHNMLAQTLGRYDLEGQLRELEAVRKSAEQLLEDIRKTQKDKQKFYQTLGLCAGAALVILLV